MTHRDGFPRLSARSAWRGDAGHRKPRATPSESLGKPSLWVIINETWYQSRKSMPAGVAGWRCDALLTGGKNRPESPTG